MCDKGPRVSNQVTRTTSDIPSSMCVCVCGVKGRRSGQCLSVVDDGSSATENAFWNQ